MIQKILCAARRVFWASLTATWLAASTAIAQSGDPLKVGIYLPFPENSLRGQLHDSAIAEMIKEFSGSVQFSVNRGVPASGISDRIDRLETESYAGMLLASPAYYNPAVARLVRSSTPMYVSIMADYTKPQKASTFGVRMYEAFYLAGVMAGRMSRHGLAGFVGGSPTVESARNLNAYLLGMRSENERAEVKAVFIGRSANRELERKAASWLMNKSEVDILVTDTDSDEVLRMAAANRVWTVPMRVSDSIGQKISEFALFHVRPNWSSIYRKQINRMLAGQKQPAFSWDGLREGAIEISNFNPALPISHIEAVSKAAQEIALGKRAPFDGPIDGKGQKIIALGQTLTDEQLMKMNFFIAGIGVLKSN